jgi:hypothetical protein
LRYIWANRKSKKKEEGRRKKEEGRSYLLVATNSHAQLPIKNYAASF